MKANEAPEKIYIPTAGDEMHYHMACTKNDFKESVEYSRTDAFIEKAMKFLYDYNKNMVKKHGSRAVLGCSEFTISVGEFRKYMKGE